VVLALRPPNAAVIVVVPEKTAVTLPVLSTVAMFGAEKVQVA